MDRKKKRDIRNWVKSCIRVIYGFAMVDLLLISLVGLYITKSSLSQEEQNFQSELDTISNTISEAGTVGEENPEEMWNMMDYVLMTDCTKGTEVRFDSDGETNYLNNMRCQILDEDGNVKASSDQAILFCFKDYSPIYALEESQKEEVEAAILEMKEKYFNEDSWKVKHNYYSYTIQPDVIYVKGNQFLIGSLCVYGNYINMDAYTVMDSPTVNRPVGTMTLDVDTTGYQEMDLELNDIQALVYDAGNPADSQLVKECQNYTDANGYTGDGISQKVSSFTYAIAGSQEIAIGGENYTIFLYDYYDVNAATNRFIWKVAWGIIVISFSLSLLLTPCIYDKGEAKYRREAYRREPSNRQLPQNKVFGVESPSYLSITENGSYQLKQEKICMEYLIRSQLDHYESQLSNAGITVKVIGNNTSRWNRETAEQVVHNLLTNIAKFAKPNSICQITLDPNQILFENEYEGALNQTGEELMVAKGQGTGLGLATTKNAVILNGYQFIVEAQKGKFLAKIVMEQEN